MRNATSSKPNEVPTLHGATCARYGSTGQTKPINLDNTVSI